MITLMFNLIFGLFGVLFGLIWWMIKAWFAIAFGFMLGVSIF